MWTTEDKNLNTEFIFVTMKQSQGHPKKNDNAHPKQGYNDAKFEISCFSAVWGKANVKFLSNEELCQWSPLHKCENQK